MIKKLLSLLAVTCGLSAPVLAATSTYTVYSTAGSIVCGSDAICSTINHLAVRTVTVSGTAGTALYTWNSTCPSSPDAVFYIRPTGATTGCFVLEGFAPATSTGVSSVTGTTNQVTSSPTTGSVVLSLPSTLVAPGTISSTSVNVSGSTPSANGLYLPSANTLGISVNSLQVGRFTSTGLNATNIGATTPGTGVFTSITSNNITGSTQCLQANSTGVISGTGSSCSTPAGTPYFRVFRNTSAQTLTASGATLIQFNAASLDPNSVCNLTTTFVCTPLVAGLYYFYCQVNIASTTGGAAGNNALADAQLAINGTTAAQAYVSTQVSSLTSPRFFAQVSTVVVMNGSTDTVSCKSSTDTTAPTAMNGATLTYMYGYRLGPQ